MKAFNLAFFVYKYGMGMKINRILFKITPKKSIFENKIISNHKYMKHKFLFLGLLLILSKIVNAQTDFREGYVITNDNDTLYGEIDYRGDILMGKVCRLKLNDNIIKYSPFEIAAYRFSNGGKYFVSKEVDGDYLFLEFLIKGQLNIYYYRDDNQNDRYYIEKADLPLSELTYEESKVYLEDKQSFHQSTKHIGLLYYYMQDAPEIHSQIRNIKKPEHNKLLKLAKNYHYAVCLDGDDCIVFEKKKPLEFALYMVGGAIDFGFDKNIYFNGGTILNIGIPSVSEKLFFRTGVMYVHNAYEIREIAGLQYESGKYSGWKIPLMFEYKYPKSAVRPKAAYGIGLSYYGDGYGELLSNCYMVGLDINVYKSFNISLEYNADFAGRLIIPQHFVSQYLLCGLCIKF